MLFADICPIGPNVSYMERCDTESLEDTDLPKTTTLLQTVQSIEYFLSVLDQDYLNNMFPVAYCRFLKYWPKGQREQSQVRCLQV